MGQADRPSGPIVLAVSSPRRHVPSASSDLLCSLVSVVLLFFPLTQTDRACLSLKYFPGARELGYSAVASITILPNLEPRASATGQASARAAAVPSAA